MERHEVTTILSGSRGVPTIVVREPGWEQQAAAEREAQRQDETKAFIAQIERDRVIRDSAPRPPLRPADPVEQVYADYEREKWLADCAESRAWPEKLAGLEEWARKAELERLMEPAAPPEPMRRGRPVSKAEQLYEAAQLDHKLRQDAAAGCGACMNCRTGSGCLYR